MASSKYVKYGEQQKAPIWEGDLNFDNLPSYVSTTTSRTIPCKMLLRYASPPYADPKSLIPLWPSSVSVELMPKADINTAEEIIARIEVAIDEEKGFFLQPLLKTHNACVYYPLINNETKIMIISVYDNKMRRAFAKIPKNEQMYIKKLQQLGKIKYDNQSDKSEQADESPSKPTNASNEHRCVAAIQQFNKVLEDRDKYRDKYRETIKKYKKARKKNKELTKNYDNLKSEKKKLKADTKKLIEEKNVQLKSNCQALQRKTVAYNILKLLLKSTDDMLKSNGYKSITDLLKNIKEQKMKLEKLERYLSQDMLKAEVKTRENAAGSLNETCTKESPSNTVWNHLLSSSPGIAEAYQLKLLYRGANEPIFTTATNDSQKTVDESICTSVEEETSSDESEDEEVAEEKKKAEGEASSSSSNSDIFKQQLDDMLNKMVINEDPSSPAAERETEDESEKKADLVEDLPSKSNIDLSTQENIYKEIQRVMSIIKVQMQQVDWKSVTTANTAGDAAKETSELPDTVEAEFENSDRFEEPIGESSSDSDYEKIEYDGSDDVNDDSF